MNRKSYMSDEKYFLKESMMRERWIILLLVVFAASLAQAAFVDVDGTHVLDETELMTLDGASKTIGANTYTMHVSGADLWVTPDWIETVGKGAAFVGVSLPVPDRHLVPGTTQWKFNITNTSPMSVKARGQIYTSGGWVKPGSMSALAFGDSVEYILDVTDPDDVNKYQVYIYQNTGWTGPVSLHVNIPPTTKLPHSPSPAIGAVDQPLSGITLQWDAAWEYDYKAADPNAVPFQNIDDDVIGHFVYYQANSSDFSGVTPAYVDSTDGAVEATASYAIPDTFVANDTVYWKIESQVVGGYPAGDPNNIIGNVWSFDVAQSVPVIDRQPRDIAVEIGDSVVMDIIAHDSAGTVAIEYQWYEGAAGDVSVPLGVQTNDPNLYITVVTAADLDIEYWCEVFRNGSSIESDSAVVYEKGLIAHWPLDSFDAAGISDPNLPTVIDATGNGYDGQVYRLSTDASDNVKLLNATDPSIEGPASSGVQVVSGVFGNALRFDGLNCVRIDEKNLPRPDEFTVTMWVNIASKAVMDSDVFFTFRDSNTRSSLVTSGSGSLGYAQWLTSNSAVYGGPVLDHGQWIHLAATFDYHHMTIYLNGERINQSDDTEEYDNWGAETMMYFATHLAGKSAQNKQLEGDLDEIKLYNYAMTNVELADEYVAASGLEICVAKWDLANDDCMATLDDLLVFVGEWIDDPLDATSTEDGYKLWAFSKLAQEWMTTVYYPTNAPASELP